MTENKPNKINITKYFLHEDTNEVYISEEAIRNCTMVSRGIHSVSGDAILLKLQGDENNWTFKNNKETIAFLSKYMTLVEEENV